MRIGYVHMWTQCLHSPEEGAGPLELQAVVSRLSSGRLEEQHMLFTAEQSFQPWWQ